MPNEQSGWPEGERSTAAGRSGGLRRRGWLLVVAALVIAGMVVAAVLSTRSDPGGDTGSNATDNTPALSRAETCAAELNTVLDLQYDAVRNGGGGSFSIIGLQNPMAQIVGNGLLADFAATAVNQGVSTAEEKIVPEIRSKCAAAKNPILTQAQVGQLIAIASPGDVTVLQQVSLFSS